MLLHRIQPQYLFVDVILHNFDLESDLDLDLLDEDLDMDFLDEDLDLYL